MSKKELTQALLGDLVGISPLPGLTRSLVRALVSVEAASANDDIGSLLQEAREQEVSLKLMEVQARVAQEVAIASRIALAEDVEIEEFYEDSKDGHVGIKADGETIALGLGAATRGVTKRIYRFKGGAKTEQILDFLLNIKPNENERD